MLRMFGVFAMMTAVAITAPAANLVSMKLCASKDYEAATRNCAPGRGLPDGVQIDPSEVSALELLTTIKSSDVEEIYHVWVFEGKSRGTVAVYDALMQAGREADPSELVWLRARKIEGARLIVRMMTAMSGRFRLRSQKSISKTMIGPWRVAVYGANSLRLLGEIRFTVAAADRNITQ